MRKRYDPLNALTLPLVGQEVICNQVGFCKDSDYCGGARPHIFDSVHCNKCKFNPEARCVLIRNIGENDVYL